MSDAYDAEPEEWGEPIDPEIWTAALVPLVVLAGLVWLQGPWVGLLGLVLVGGVAAAAHHRWRDLPVALAAGGLTPLLVTSVPAGLGVLGAGVLIGAGVVVGPWIALLGIPVAYWPTPIAALLASVAVAAALLLPDGLLPVGHRLVRHLIGLAVAAVALLGPVGSWAPLATYAVAVAVLLVEAHPARDRLVPASRDALMLAAAAPALVFLLLALLGKELGPDVLSLLAVGWAAVALGLLFLPAAFGAQVFLEDPGPAGRLWLGVAAAGALAAASVAATGALRATAPGLAVAWAPVAVAAAVGARQVLARVGPLRPWGWAVIAILAMLALGTHSALAR